jgi:hypothetical protein
MTKAIDNVARSAASHVDFSIHKSFSLFDFLPLARYR